MKALSVRQPWADMICSGEKGIEFRSRPTSHRGKLLICSSKFNEGYTVEIDGVQKPLPLGMMLCVVNLIGCEPVTSAHKKEPGCPSAMDGYAWIFDDYVGAIVPKPVIGRLGLFDVPEVDIEHAPDDKFWFDYL